MLRIAIIDGSTRPGRKSPAVADWVVETGGSLAPVVDAGVVLERIDLAAVALPLYDEPVAAVFGRYSHPHTRAWADRIAGFDGFVFVTPEYNHSLPAALKNAIDFLYAEWADKAAGFVSFGVDGGVRAVEHLRGILAEVGVATVAPQVALSLFDDFDHGAGGGRFAPRERHRKAVEAMLGRVIAWSTALRAGRARAEDAGRGADDGPSRRRR